MGLGLLGGGVGDAIFLAEHGAKLTITDLKTKEELRESIKKLAKFKGIKYVLGKHKKEDFKNADMILQPGNVPTHSLYLKEAKKNKIPIFVSESLFTKYAPNVKIIGVTGTRGKSMTTALIYEILSKNLKGRKVYLGGNTRDVSTLALLSKARQGDIVVMELDSWALHGMGDIKKSPEIAVFTSFMPDHMNYYKGSMKKYFDDKANIFKFQKKGDMLVIRPDIKKLIPKNIQSKLIVVNKKEVADWSFNVLGDHHRENLACAVAVAKIFGIRVAKIKASVAKFTYLEGRMQLLRTYREVKIYNDNNATTPEATIAGIGALKNKNIILICGGADKELKVNNFIKVVNKSCKFLITIPGTGTDRLLGKKLKVESYKAKNLKDAVKKAIQKAKKGDTILFSPAFASFGMFKNEYDRGDEFVKIIKSL